jgi:hypothetical protein
MSVLGFVSLMHAAAHADEGQNLPPQRQFNDVLGDLLDEFSYDLRTSQVPLTVNLSVRKVSLSDNVPVSYEKYMETMIAERVRQFSQAKVILCTTCRIKQSVVRDGRVSVTTPINNKRALDQLAREYGIESWLDVGIIYQETSLIMAMNLFDAKTKELLWSRVYNSETLYKRFPSGVPDPETDRKGLQEQPSGPVSEYIFGLAIGWALVPNVNDSVNMLALPIRFSEVFNRKRSEAGAQVVALVDTEALLARAQTEPGVVVESSDQVTRAEGTKILKSFRYGVGLFGTYHHNFRPAVEDLDTIRPGIQGGAGVILAASYLSFTGKIGMNLRMGHSLFIDAEVLYSAPATIELAEGFEYTTPGGVGALASFGLNL